MRNLKRFNGKMIAMAAAGALALVFSVGAATVAGQDYMAPRTAFGTPDLNGIWQAMGAHHWNIEPHAASHGPVVELGALGAIPGGLGIVQGGEIPYTAAARALQQENAQHWVERDPAAKCYMPGIPAGDLHAVSVPDRADRGVHSSSRTSSPAPAASST